METLRRAEFNLLYYIKGMTPERIDKMDGVERLWWMKRLLQEKKMESRKAGPFRPPEE